MTINQLLKEYDLDSDMTYFDAIQRQKSTGSLRNEVCIRHTKFSWLMDTIWGHVECGNLSHGKARELTAYATEKYFKEQINN